jgi:hypothetical protein
MAGQDQDRDNVPEATAGAMPEGTIDPKQWWHHPNLRTMNLLMFFPLLSIFTLGYVLLSLFGKPSTDYVGNQLTHTCYKQIRRLYDERSPGS